MIKEIPVVSVEDFEQALDYITEFYKVLGWDSNKQELDSSKIKIHPKTWEQICSNIKKRWGIGSALAWMNYGPSGDKTNGDYLGAKEIDVPTDAFVSVEKGRVQ